MCAFRIVAEVTQSDDLGVGIQIILLAKLGIFKSLYLKKPLHHLYLFSACMQIKKNPKIGKHIWKKYIFWTDFSKHFIMIEVNDTDL